MSGSSSLQKVIELFLKSRSLDVVFLFCIFDSGSYIATCDIPIFIELIFKPCQKKCILYFYSAVKHPGPNHQYPSRGLSLKWLFLISGRLRKLFRSFSGGLDSNLARECATSLHINKTRSPVIVFPAKLTSSHMCSLEIVHAGAVRL